MVDIWFLGQAAFRIKGKNTSVVLDPYSKEIGFAMPKVEADIVCVSHDHPDHNEISAVKGIEDKEPFVISGPGDYEISGVNILGVASFHDDKEGAERGKNVIYQLTVDGVNIVHLGDIGQKKLTQSQVEELSCDVLMIPVGGVYTIEAKDAQDIIAQLEPKVIIPMHYKLPGLKYDLAPIDNFLAAMGKEKVEPTTKYSISAEKLPEEPEIVILEKS